jgi:hypothetical protein
MYETDWELIYIFKKLHHKVGHTVALTEFCVHQVINAQDD